MMEPIVHYGIASSCGDGAGMTIAQHQRIMDRYRQMVSTMLGILDELDTADGWIVIRDSARAELEALCR